MPRDPDHRPRLRPVEAFPVDVDGHQQIGVRDSSGLSPVVLSMSQPALLLLSLLDGSRTITEVRADFQRAVGQVVSDGIVVDLVDKLDEAHLLEGPGFEAYYQTMQQEYRAQPSRPMPHAEALGITDDHGSLFRELLAQMPTRALSGPVQGLIAPHLDYPRGEPAYVAAYATLRDRPRPQRVIILGTNHAGRGSSVVATDRPFATPLGVTPVDVDFLERLEAQCGDLRRYDLDHAREHSIELQVGWLQHLFGADAFEMVPLLCPDPCGPTGTAPWNGEGVDLATFGRELAGLLADDPRDTLVVAGADLSHVGPEFGDEEPLSDEWLAEVRQRDQQALEAVVAGDARGFLDRVAAGQNPTRVCSAGCIYVLMAALPEGNGTLLHYHQAVDEARLCGVTCAAVAFV